MKAMIPLAAGLLVALTSVGTLHAQGVPDDARWTQYDTDDRFAGGDWRELAAARAHRLADESARMVELARALGAPPNVLRSAYQLARLTEAIHRDIENGATLRELSRALEALSSRQQRFIDALTIASHRGNVPSDPRLERWMDAYDAMRGVLATASRRGRQWNDGRRRGYGEREWSPSYRDDPFARRDGRRGDYRFER